MSKVWLVIHADRHVVAVFDSEEKAEAYADQSVWLDVEEWEVQ